MVPVLTRTAGRAAAAFTPDVCLAGSGRLAVAPIPAPCRRGGGHSHGALFCRRAREVTRRRAVDDGDLGASSLDKGFEVQSESSVCDITLPRCIRAQHWVGSSLGSSDMPRVAMSRAGDAATAARRWKRKPEVIFLVTVCGDITVYGFFS